MDRWPAALQPRALRAVAHPQGRPHRLPVRAVSFKFALRTLSSTFDDEEALRPYVFSLHGRSRRDPVEDLWRGTALSRPIALAALIGGSEGETLCALLRGDSFLAPDPATTARTWTAWRWNAFGFSPSEDASACATQLDPAGILAR